MQLTAGRLLNAFLVLNQIINERRPLPQKGAYWLARLYAGIETEARVVEAQQRDLVIRMGHKISEEGAGQWQVPKHKMPEYLEKWKEIAEVQIEVNCQPIPLASLGEHGTLLAHEFLTLGPLIQE